MKKFLSSNAFRVIWSASLAALLFYICPPCFSKITIGIVLGVLVVLINGSSILKKLPIIVFFVNLYEKKQREKRFKKKLEELKKRDPFVYKNF